MFCLAVATEAPSDLKNPVSLSTSYRSLQPLKNSATSFVPTHPPSNQSVLWLLNKRKRQASKQRASNTCITCLVLGNQGAMELQRLCCKTCLNKHDKPSAGLSTFANCIVQARCRDTDCTVVHRNADLGPTICVLLVKQQYTIHSNRPLCRSLCQGLVVMISQCEQILDE